jgi:hypothetical protein
MLNPKKSFFSKVKNSLLSIVGKTPIVKIIEFRARDRLTEMVLSPPIPSSKIIPEWYKNLPLYRNPSIPISRGPDKQTNLTAKACIPVLDAVVSGYMLTLPCDVTFTDQDKVGQRVIWDVSWNVITSHKSDQVGGNGPAGYEPDPYKWEGMWEIHMPKGYSFLITHPFYRYDLPFLTTTAIVDGDGYTRPLNLPFFLLDNFMGTIPKGTPIAQIIPIKREQWQHIVTSHDPDSIYTIESLKTTIFRSYKERWWNKKTYN